MKRILQVLAVLLTAAVVLLAAWYLILMALRATAHENAVIWIIIVGAALVAWSFGLFKNERV